MRYFLTTILLILSFASQAQVLDWFRHQRDNNPAEVSFAIDSRNSFVGQVAFKMTGIQLNWKRGDYWSYGISYYNNYLFGNQKVELDHVGIQSEVLLFSDKDWQFRMSALMAFGSMQVTYTEQSSDAYIAYENVLSVKRQVFDYFYLSGGLGFRLGLYNKQYKNARISAPIYQIGLGVNLAKVWQKIKK